MFDWDEANEGHIWERHGVSALEAENVLLSPDRSAYSSRIERAEKRFLVIGSTAAGRVLSVVYMWRGSRIRVVSARDPSVRELRHFRATRKGKR